MSIDTLLVIAFAIVFIGGPFWLLSKMDKRGGTSQKFSRIVMRWSILLGVSALVIYGAFWATTHPNNPLALWFAIGVIIFVAVVSVKDRIMGIMGWIKISSSVANFFSKSLSKSRDSSPLQKVPESKRTVDQIEDQVLDSDNTSNTTTVFEKIWKIVFGISVVIFGVFWISTYSNSPSWWCILGVFAFLVLALWLVNWISKPHEPSDPFYLELRALFREKLLPLNFQEKETYGLGDHLRYTRGQSALSMGTEYRDNLYYFKTSNPNVNIERSLSEGKQFKTEVLEKFEAWLAKQ